MWFFLPELGKSCLSDLSLLPADYLYFFVGWMAWTMDGYDFQSVSLSISRLAVYYGKERESISTSITLTLLFRPVGAIIFGLAGDLYGRKWPMIANLIVIAILELATAYCTKFSTFLIVCVLRNGCESS